VLEYPKYPLVFNEYPDRLVQLNMEGSVGRGGVNSGSDVRLVQTLLNLLPLSQGRPIAELVVDGLAGPLTNAAIERYQRESRLVVDGRIDINGPTIRKLVTELNSRDALPGDNVSLKPPKPEIARALTGQSFAQSSGGYQSVQSIRHTLFGPAAAPRRAWPLTGWKINTTGGFDFSITIFGAAYINIYLTHDVEPGMTYRFPFIGAMVGLSMLPIGLDVFFSATPSIGTNIVCALPIPDPDPLPRASSFDLMEATVITVGANVGPGVSGNVLLLKKGLRAYVGAVAGTQAGMPGGSITACVGAIAGHS
jgi:hypothetical protein